MATYNGERYVEAQMLSLLEQTCPPDEVIIADDCSTDSTCAIIDHFIDSNDLKNTWTFIKRSSNFGYARNFLDALTLSSNDFIFLSDQDDVWHPKKIEQMTNVMADNPHFSMLACRMCYIDDQGNTYRGKKSHIPYFRINKRQIFEKKTVQDFIISNIFRGCTMCIRENVIASVNPKFVTGPLGHDWYLSLLAALKGECAFYNKTLVRYRIHNANVTVNAKSFDHNKNQLVWLRDLKTAVDASQELLVSYPEHFSRLNQFTDFLNLRISLFETMKIKYLFRLIGKFKYYLIYGHTLYRALRGLGGDLGHYVWDLARKLRKT